MIRRCLFALLTGFAAAGAAAADWPTLHGDPTRSGFYPSFPKPPLKLVWRKELHKELTAPRAEIIVASGLAFMGTSAGNLYARDAKTGDQRWLVKTNGPIGSMRNLFANAAVRWNDWNIDHCAEHGVRQTDVDW